LNGAADSLDETCAETEDQSDERARKDDESRKGKDAENESEGGSKTHGEQSDEIGTVEIELRVGTVGPERLHDLRERADHAEEGAHVSEGELQRRVFCPW
jgi:hypothetical protein